jgi:hypothetical protein
MDVSELVSASLVFTLNLPATIVVIRTKNKGKKTVERKRSLLPPKKRTKN